MQECWTPTSTYVNPLTDVVCGIDGLTRLILDYPVLFPDVQILGCRKLHPGSSGGCERFARNSRSCDLVAWPS